MASPDRRGEPVTWPREPAGPTSPAGRRKHTTVALAAIAAGLTAVAACTSLSPNVNTYTPAAAQVRMEPTSSAGTDAFMAPVGQDDASIAPVRAGGVQPGDTNGLYGQVGDTPSCDAQSLLANLQADSAKASAWAQALGITPADIPMFVASMSPVLLRADTAVTNHG
jgi:Tfp pilus assembly protein PilW